MVWYIVVVLLWGGETVDKIYPDRFSSAAICEAWVPVAKASFDGLNLEAIKVKGIECRSEKIIDEKPKIK